MVTLGLGRAGCLMLWKGRANMGVRGAVGVGAGVEVTVEVEAGVRVEVEVGVLAGATRLRLKQDLDMCPGALRDHGHHRTGHAVAAYHQIAWTRIEKWDDNINICNGASGLLVLPECIPSLAYAFFISKPCSLHKGSCSESFLHLSSTTGIFSILSLLRYPRFFQLVYHRISSLRVGAAWRLSVRPLTQSRRASGL